MRTRQRATAIRCNKEAGVLFGVQRVNVSKANNWKEDETGRAALSLTIVICLTVKNSNEPLEKKLTKLDDRTGRDVVLF